MQDKIKIKIKKEKERKVLISKIQNLKRKISHPISLQQTNRLKKDYTLYKIRLSGSSSTNEKPI